MLTYRLSVSETQVLELLLGRISSAFEWSVRIHLPLRARSIIPNIVSFSPQLVDWVVCSSSTINEAYCSNDDRIEE